jgi:hypothetical protein
VILESGKLDEEAIPSSGRRRAIRLGYQASPKRRGVRSNIAIVDNKEDEAALLKRINFGSFKSNFNIIETTREKRKTTANAGGACRM